MLIMEMNHALSNYKNKCEQIIKRKEIFMNKRRITLFEI